jgi:ABC-type molybdate transport system substrate-binding protein
MVRRWGLTFAALLVGAGDARAWNSPAPDVVLYCTAALEAPLSEVARRYGAASHVEVHMFVAPPDGLIGLIKHRARADVVVADTPTLASLAASGLVRVGSVAALGRDPFVLIAAAASSGETAATVLPDPTTAASFDGRAVLQAAMPPVSPARVIGVSDTPEVAAMVRGDAGLAGLVHATEAHAAGLRVAAPVPAPPTPMSGGLVVNGQSANAAALLDFISGPEGTAVLHAAGMEPPA